MNSSEKLIFHRELKGRHVPAVIALGAGCFQLAYTFPICGFLILVWLWALLELSGIKSARLSFYAGLIAGMLAYGPQLGFLWTIFGPPAIALWLIMSFWTGLFACLGRACRIRFGDIAAAIIIPFLWTGLEYFRSEIIYLRFSWLNEAYLFSGHTQWLGIRFLGMYGLGFVLMAAISLSALFRPKVRLVTNGLLVAVLAILSNLPGTVPPLRSLPPAIKVAGIQLEFPSESIVLQSLRLLARKYPEAQLLVLSEYTFLGPVPQTVKDWCRENGRYLIIGGEEPANGSDYYDTAFVIGPSGEIVFSQGKSVPVQFFKDGLPAKTQQVWDSPWGKIGLCICYDLSYRRVTDELIRQGAQAIIVPTMDVAEWGRHQHELHARVAPIRCAEYGVPIFRVGSSGISQLVDPTGGTLASAPMPGEGAMLAGALELVDHGTIPLDRFLTPIALGVTGVTDGLLTGLAVHKKTDTAPKTDIS